MSDFGDALRRDFQGKRSGGTRGAKLARVFARPEQLTVQGASPGGDGQRKVIINPPGQDALARADREAKEARKAAEEAKARAGLT